MGMYTVIEASDDQINAFYEKHMKPVTRRFLWKEMTNNMLVMGSMRYSWDDDDHIGFFHINTKSGKSIACQVWRGEPMFVELTGFGSIRYDISYPSQRSNCKEFYTVLKALCKEAEERFWKGGEI